MRAGLRDPRVRIVLLLLAVLLLGGLTGHAVGMADHGVGMAIGTCLATLVVIGLPAMPRVALLRASGLGIDVMPRTPLGRVAERSSHPPPKDGTILRS